MTSPLECTHSELITTNQFASLVAVVGAGEADPGGQEVGRAGHCASQAGVQRLTGHVT